MPIDDASHNFFATQLLPRQPDEVAPYVEAYERYLNLWKGHPSR